MVLFLSKQYVGIELLSRERLISAQKEELALPYSKLFSEEAAEKVHVFYLMKDEVLMRTWRPLDVICQIVIPEE